MIYDMIFCSLASDFKPSPAIAHFVENIKKQHNETVTKMDMELTEAVQEANENIIHEKEIFCHKLISIISAGQRIVHEVCESEASSLIKYLLFIPHGNQRQKNKIKICSHVDC